MRSVPAGQPGFVPVCEVRPDGSCHIDDPSTSTICPNSYEPCQYNAVHTYYDQVGGCNQPVEQSIKGDGAGEAGEGAELPTPTTDQARLCFPSLTRTGASTTHLPPPPTPHTHTPTHPQLEKDYENAREDAIKGTNSMVFNTFIWCQVRGRAGRAGGRAIERQWID